ncbi:MAG: EamA family transporter [Candidatus Sericytochromatia bacterium]|nr:EamA family transporter [Candidatus Sericytochromatia bacterium]
MKERPIPPVPANQAEHHPPLRGPARAPLLALGALVASMVSLCVGSSFAKTLFPVLGAAGTTALRLAFAAGLMLAIARPWRRPPAARDLRLLAFYGLVLGGMNLCIYQAIARIPFAVAIAIELAGPLTLAILASRRPRDLLWTGLTLLGLALLLPWQIDATALDPRGIAFALAAAACWAAYIVLGQRLGHLPSLQATALGLLAAALVVVPWGLPAWQPILQIPALLGWGLFVAVFSSALPYSLEMAVLPHLSKPVLGSWLSLEPVIGALTAWLILGEHLSASQALAIACIVIACAGSARSQPPRPPAAQ